MDKIYFVDSKPPTSTEWEGKPYDGVVYATLTEAVDAYKTYSRIELDYLSDLYKKHMDDETVSLNEPCVSYRIGSFAVAGEN